MPKPEPIALPIRRPRNDFDYLSKFNATETAYYPRHDASRSILDKTSLPLKTDKII